MEGLGVTATGDLAAPEATSQPIEEWRTYKRNSCCGSDDASNERRRRSLTLLVGKEVCDGEGARGREQRLDTEHCEHSYHEEQHGTFDEAPRDHGGGKRYQQRREYKRRDELFRH